MKQGAVRRCSGGGRACGQRAAVVQLRVCRQRQQHTLLLRLAEGIEWALRGPCCGASAAGAAGARPLDPRRACSGGQECTVPAGVKAT